MIEDSVRYVDYNDLCRALKCNEHGNVQEALNLQFIQQCNYLLYIHISIYVDILKVKVMWYN